MTMVVAGAFQNHFTCAAITAGITAATPIVYGIATWISSHEKEILDGAKTAYKIKECITDSKVKLQKDECFKTLDYLKDNVSYLKTLNISNFPEAQVMIQEVVRNVMQYESVDQWVTDLNLRTETIWNNFDESTRREMIGKGVLASKMSSRNIPKSAAEIGSWINNLGECIESQKKYVFEIAELKRKNTQALEDFRKTNEDFHRSKDAHKEETDPLKERKGECHELEKIKAKSEACEAKREEYHALNTRLEGEKDKWKTLYEELKKQNIEDNKWFFRRWTGL